MNRPPVVTELRIIDEPHREVWARLRADGSVELSATTGDPHEYAVLRPGEVAQVGHTLLQLADRATEQANAPAATFVVREVPACTLCGLVGHLAENCPRS